jgi:hypothetical protein
LEAPLKQCLGFSVLRNITDDAEQVLPATMPESGTDHLYRKDLPTFTSMVGFKGPGASLRHPFPVFHPESFIRIRVDIHHAHLQQLLTRIAEISYCCPIHIPDAAVLPEKKQAVVHLFNRSLG